MGRRKAWAAWVLIAGCGTIIGCGSIGGAGSGPDPGRSPEPEPLNCADANSYLPQAPEPIRRLSAREYERAVRSLFPQLNVADARPILAGAREGFDFDNNVGTQVVDDLIVQNVSRVAEDVGRVASADQRWLPCDPSGNQEAVSYTHLTLPTKRIV